jgi:hypothetical protein
MKRKRKKNKKKGKKKKKKMFPVQLSNVQNILNVFPVPLPNFP